MKDNDPYSSTNSRLSDRVKRLSSRVLKKPNLRRCNECGRVYCIELNAQDISITIEEHLSRCQPEDVL